MPTYEEDDFDRGEVRAPAETSGKAIVSLILGVLSLCAGLLAGIPGLILGILGLNEINRSRGKLSGRGIAIAGIVTSSIGTVLVPLVLLGLLMPAVQEVREASTRIQSANNMREIGLAMHSYHDANGAFPPAVVYSKDRKPLYSWRVLLLPYLEADNIYRQFKLDEPWDSPNNKPLLAQIPRAYLFPKEQPADPYATVYQVLDGPGAAFESDPKLGLQKFSGLGVDVYSSRRMRIADFTDGISNTIMVVEAADPVPWTKPADIAYDPNQPPPRMGGRFAGGFNALYTDGSVHFIPFNTRPETLRLLIVRNDDQQLPPDAP